MTSCHDRPGKLDIWQLNGFRSWFTAMPYGYTTTSGQPAVQCMDWIVGRSRAVENPRLMGGSSKAHRPSRGDSFHVRMINGATAVARARLGWTLARYQSNFHSDKLLVDQVRNAVLPVIHPESFWASNEADSDHSGRKPYGNRATGPVIRYIHELFWSLAPVRDRELFWWGHRI